MHWLKVIVGVLIIAAFGWVGWSVTRPVPGTKIEDQGREHVSVAEVTAYQYNSNPPTSGPHLPTWVKAGVYETPQGEGELIHSLEHGYVIISYNCNVHLKAQNANLKTFLIQNVFAHEEEEASPSAEFVNESEGCKTLVKNFTELATRKKLWKLIVVARPQLTTTIALTAWTYIDAFDSFDAARIERFIDYHRDQGPEKTME